ncbi:MAG: alpha/beta hydrolase [Robiginitomaculum sp.]|nr:alpha/beta hydrolase [Robiginitomaculum sp.]
MREEPTRQNGAYTTIEAWDSPTGASLCVYHKKAPGSIKGSIKSKPKASPKAIIHINHGLGEHAGRYARFAETLSAAGYAVYAQDHRGHGATTAPDARQGVFATGDGWNKTLADMKYVNGEIRKRHKDIPIIMFGHSMGAMLTYNYLLRWPETIDACAVWNADLSKNPALKLLGLILRIENKFKGANAPSIANAMTFGAFNKKFKPNQTRCDWLSKDVEECREYDADPDCGWPVTVSMWQDVVSGIAYGSSDKGLENVPKHMPIYLLGGDADPSTRNAKAQSELTARLKAAGLTNIKTTIRKHGRHEALNEPKAERDAVMAEFVDWVGKAII